jgi:hypothetical protein
MKKHSFPFNELEIPKNGIYILFEKGETSHGMSRIVRVGTHTGKNQLLSRLKQHFIMENKDRSIFRKNIGRAILNKSKDPFLKDWEIDLTTKKAKDKFKDKIDFNKQREIEKQVTKYLQDNFSFVVFEINDKNKRLELESKIISSLSSCDHCSPSPNWLGLSSPKEKIKSSGLWLVNELNKEPLSESDFQELKSIIK